MKSRGTWSLDAPRFSRDCLRLLRRDDDVCVLDAWNHEAVPSIARILLDLDICYAELVTEVEQGVSEQVVIAHLLTLTRGEEENVSFHELSESCLSHRTRLFGRNGDLHLGKTLVQEVVRHHVIHARLEGATLLNGRVGATNSGFCPCFALLLHDVGPDHDNENCERRHKRDNADRLSHENVSFYNQYYNCLYFCQLGQLLILNINLLINGDDCDVNVLTYTPLNK